MRVLVLEPFLGGSHARLVDGLVAHLPFRFEVLGLPARHWKSRMRFAAAQFAERLRNRVSPAPEFDVAFASSYLDVSVFRALAPERVGRLPLILYFHENQGYLDLLRRSHLVVSTAHHEFQGLSVLEAVAQGATPLLPRRLSYPELFPERVLYRDRAELTSRLRQRICFAADPDPELLAGVVRFAWSELATAYRSEIENAVKTPVHGRR